MKPTKPRRTNSVERKSAVERWRALPASHRRIVLNGYTWFGPVALDFAEELAREVLREIARKPRRTARASKKRKAKR